MARPALRQLRRVRPGDVSRPVHGHGYELELDDGDLLRVDGTRGWSAYVPRAADDRGTAHGQHRHHRAARRRDGRRERGAAHVAVRELSAAGLSPPADFVVPTFGLAT